MNALLADMLRTRADRIYWLAWMTLNWLVTMLLTQAI